MPYREVVCFDEGRHIEFCFSLLFIDAPVTVSSNPPVRGSELRIETFKQSLMRFILVVYALVKDGKLVR